jgi:hypothetical protein
VSRRFARARGLGRQEGEAPAGQRGGVDGARNVVGSCARVERRTSGRGVRRRQKRMPRCRGRARREAERGATTWVSWEDLSPFVGESRRSRVFNAYAQVAGGLTRRGGLWSGGMPRVQIRAKRRARVMTHVKCSSFGVLLAASVSRGRARHRVVYGRIPSDRKRAHGSPRLARGDVAASPDRELRPTRFCVA